MEEDETFTCFKLQMKTAVWVKIIFESDPNVCLVKMIWVIMQLQRDILNTGPAAFVRTAQQHGEPGTRAAGEMLPECDEYVNEDVSAFTVGF